MKKKVFIKLNLVWILAFLVFFAIILFSVNPFQASTFVFIIFYLVFFGLTLGILNLIGIYFKIPFWCRLLIAIAIIFILIVQANKV